MKRLFTSLFILVQSALAYSASASEDDALQSPYFVDGIHCIGLTQHEGPEYLLIPKEETEAHKIIEAQEDCNDLFKAFGIEKYTWMSAEDLERTAAQVNQAGYFESATLSIKKSELKNHIHVFLTVKTKSKYVYNFASRTKAYSIYENPRLFHRLNGEIIDRSLQPNSNTVFGFNLDSGFAANPMTDLDNNNNNGLSSDQIFNKNFYFVELYYKHQRMMGQSWTWSLAGRLNADNVLAGQSFDFSGSVDTDLLYSRYIRFLYGSVFGGVAAIFSPDLTYLASLYSNQQSTPTYDTPLILPGFKLGYLLGRGVGTYFRTELSGYRALYGPKSLLEWKSILQVDIGSGFLLNSSFNGKRTHNLILARDKAPSSDAMSNTASLSLIKSFGVSSDRREIEIKFGVERLGYTTHPWGPSTTPFVQTGYRVLSDSFNLDFSLSYLTTRTY